jgi:hypothetical protein
MARLVVTCGIEFRPAARMPVVCMVPVTNWPLVVSALAGADRPEGGICADPAYLAQATASPKARNRSDSIQLHRPRVMVKRAKAREVAGSVKRAVRAY